MPVGPLWAPLTPVTNVPMVPLQPWSARSEPKMQMLPPMPCTAQQEPMVPNPAPWSHGKVKLPEDLLSRIEGVVTDMEKNVAEEQRLRTSQFACSACGAALSSDTGFCDRCGRRQDVDHSAEGDLVQSLGRRLESLEQRREAAEQRAGQLVELRRLVAEGRHKQYLTHFMTLDDQGFDLHKIENGSAISTQSTGSNEVKSAEDSQLHAALAQVEDAFSEELNFLGVSGAESRLHERLEKLLKAVLHRESVAEARLKEQRKLTQTAESELQALEESSQKVLEDCRMLQARVRDLEHHETTSQRHHERATELEERVKEHSRLLDLARSREAALKEEIQEAEETSRRFQASSARKAVDKERLEALEQENEELRDLSLRQTQRAQKQIEELQAELATAKEQLSQHAHQHGELKGHSSHLESQWQSAELRASHHATRAEELEQRLLQLDEDKGQHTESLEQEVSQQRLKIQELEATLLQLGQDAESATELAQEQIDFLQHKLKDMEDQHQNVALVEERNMELMREVTQLRAQIEAGPSSPPMEPLQRRISNASADSDDFKKKVRSVKRRASELLQQAAMPNTQLLETQLRSAVQSWNQGGSLSAGLHSNAGDEASMLAERRQLAVLLDAAACDLAALKEEASTHHELLPAEMQELMHEIDLALENCKDEKGILQSSSAFDGMPETLLQSLASALGLLGGHPSMERGNWKEQTPMHWAAKHGRRDLVDFLLRQEDGDSLLDALDHAGRTPAEVAEQAGQVSVAQFLRGHMELRALRERPQEKVTFEERLPVAYQKVLKQVVSQGWDSVHWKDGFTMLHWAASKGEVDLARYLIQLRADPDVRDDTHQRTPLDWAEHEGHAEAVEMLRRQSRTRLSERLSSKTGFLKQQARSSLPASPFGGSQGSDVRDARRKSEAPIRRRSRRKSAIPEGYLPVLEEIDQQGWNNMQWTRGFTLLHWAAQNDQPELVEQLFQKAADPLQRDDDGRTALDFARESGSLEVVEALKRYSQPQARQQREDIQRQMTDLMLSTRRSKHRVSILGADDKE